MLRGFLAAATALGMLVVAPAGGTGAGAPVRYYLALGDSLSQGQQPDARGVTLNTAEGYPDQLFAKLRVRLPGLRLVKLGCGGESTGSMITGHGNGRLSKFFHCHPAGGSQLKAALRFLHAHHAAGEVPVITIDLGANDVDGCIGVPADQLGACIGRSEANIKHNLPIILRDLRRAVPKGTSMAGMTLYDPVLGQYFSADSSARSLAVASVAVIKQVNDLITGADAKAHWRTADVAGAFATYDSADMVTFDAQQIPLNVARVCSWTWACTAPPSGPNIHANKNGYAVMAAAFARVLGRIR